MGDTAYLEAYFTHLNAALMVFAQCQITSNLLNLYYNYLQVVIISQLHYY